MDTPDAVVSCSGQVGRYLGGLGLELGHSTCGTHFEINWGIFITTRRTEGMAGANTKKSDV